MLISGTLRLLAWTLRIRFVNADELLGPLGTRRAADRGVLAQPRADDAGRQPQPEAVHHEQPEPRRRDRHPGAGALGHSVGARLGDARRRRRLLAAWCDAYRDGHDLAVVPDGPRGPRYVVKAGVIHLARATGAPIFPVTYAATRQRQLRSWDRLIIPLPFARVTYVAGEPLRVPRHATDAEVETLRQELETRLNRITEHAEALVGRGTERE